jgi:hypothetical protein
MEAIARVSRAYSKQTSQTREFIADAEAKQKLASNLIRETVARWALEPYQQLERKRVQQQSGE